MTESMFQQTLRPSLAFIDQLVFVIFCAAALLYLAFLFKLALSTADTRCKLLHYVDAGIDCSARTVERDHASNCRLSVANVAAVSDRYVVAHLLGWFIKALILPFPVLLWTASIIFEFVEHIFVPFIPSLAECWWDSLILDVFGCNAIGIYLGYHIKTRYSNKNNNNCLYLSYNQLGLALFVLTITDLNAFLLKFVLDIPSSSYLNVYRILFYVALAYFSVSVPGKQHVTTTWNLQHNSMFSHMFAPLYLLLLVCELVAVSLILCLQSRPVSQVVAWLWVWLLHR